MGPNVAEVIGKCTAVRPNGVSFLTLDEKRTAAGYRTIDGVDALA